MSVISKTGRSVITSHSKIVKINIQNDKRFINITSHVKKQIALWNLKDLFYNHFINTQKLRDDILYKQIPGPEPIPIFGNTWRFFPVIGKYYALKNNALGFSRAIQKEYGDIVRLESVLGLDDAVILLNPEDIEKVYKSEAIYPHRNLSASGAYFRKNYRQDLFHDAEGLISAEGEDWYAFRKKVNPIMMQPKIVKQYIEPADKITKQFMEKLKRYRQSDNKVALDIFKEVNNWSLEYIAYVALNSKLNCLDDNQPKNAPSKKLNENMTNISKMLAKIDFEPSIWKYISTPAFRKFMKLLNEQVLLAEMFVKSAMKRLEKEQHEKSGNQSSVLEKLLEIDPKIAIVMAIDMLQAGVDTTSVGLVNVLYHLSINQSKQDKLREEILTVLPDNFTNLDAKALNSMPYLKACIKESARLYPVTSGTMRVLTKDTFLGGYWVPKGIKVLLLHIYPSLKEENFTMADEFIPERWLREQKDSKLSYKNAHPFCFMHFGYGSRSCIGRRFAEIGLEVAVVNFVKNFKISWQGPPPKKITYVINYLKEPFNFVFDDVT